MIDAIVSQEFADEFFIDGSTTLYRMAIIFLIFGLEKSHQPLLICWEQGTTDAIKDGLTNAMD